MLQRVRDIRATYVLVSRPFTGLCDAVVGGEAVGEGSAAVNNVQ